MNNNSPLTPTRPSLPHRVVRGVARLVKLIVLASGPAGAIFGYLAWQEAKSSSPDMTAAARHTEEMLRIDVEILRTLSKALPEAERTRLGIERLIAIAERQLAKASTTPRRVSPPPAPRGDSTPAPASSDREPSQEANKLVRSLFQPDVPN